MAPPTEQIGLENTRGWVAALGSRVAVLPGAAVHININININFIVPASKIRTGGETSNMKAAISLFTLFWGFPTVSLRICGANHYPTLLLSFLLSFSLHRRSREIFVRSHQRRRRLLKKPHRIDRRSTPSNRIPNMNEKASVSKELEAKHTKVFLSNLYLSIYLSIPLPFCLELIGSLAKFHCFEKEKLAVMRQM